MSAMSPPALLRGTPGCRNGLNLEDCMTADETMEKELQALHDAEGRFYHVWAHPLSMRALAVVHAGEITHHRAVDRMIITHDVVYDSRRGDNEERSAEFAARLFAPVVSSDEMVFILAGIGSTKNHVVPAGLTGTQRHDVGVLLDLDLAILGSDPATFDDYDRKIRLEYAWVSEGEWRIGRAKVMEGFLRRPHIYVTKSLRQAFEERARENVARLIESLATSRA
jgi:predicted metal-dependent HD superfamily phosphohydrolase